MRELEGAYRDALRLLATEGDPDEIGDYLEFGVFVGTSLLCMHRVSEAMDRMGLRLFGFDSFEGLPQAALTDDDGNFLPGGYKADYDLARENLTRNGVDWTRTTLVPGWFEDTLRPELAQRLGIEKAGVIFVDCDIYSSARTALQFCGPLIRDRAVIIFDDWNSDGLAAKGLGERKAFEEFLRNDPALVSSELPQPYPAAAAFLVSRNTDRELVP